MSTGEETIQNDWEFFSDMDKYLKEDPSIAAAPSQVIQFMEQNVKYKVL